jgi:hypothetical protein
MQDANTSAQSIRSLAIVTAFKNQEGFEPLTIQTFDQLQNLALCAAVLQTAEDVANLQS